MAATVRWNPWRELEQMQQRMGRMFDLAPSAFPAADVYETDADVVVEVEAPGFEEKEFWLRERLENTFERRFDLPQEIETGKVSAGFAKGVLTVHVPKAARTSPRKVPIGT